MQAFNALKFLSLSLRDFVIHRKGRVVRHWSVPQLKLSLRQSSINSMYQRLVRELRVWCTLKHVNILPILGVWNNMLGMGYPGAVTYYCEGGNLYKWIYKNENSLEGTLRKRLEYVRVLSFLRPEREH
jgi:hypothetical protein